MLMNFLIFKNLLKISALCLVLSQVMSESFSSDLNIIYFNNFNGMTFEENVDGQYYPGMIKFGSSIINRTKGKNKLILSGGNNYYGDFLSLLSKGKLTNKMFKIIGLSYSAVGPNEFEWDEEYLIHNISKNEYFSKWEKEGGFEFTSANILMPNLKIPFSWCDQYGIKNIDGIKVGIIFALLNHEFNLSKINNIVIDNPIEKIKEILAYFNKLDENDAPDFVIIGISSVNPVYLNKSYYELLSFSNESTLLFIPSNSYKEIIVDSSRVYQVPDIGYLSLEVKSNKNKDLSFNSEYIKFLPRDSIIQNEALKNFYNKYKEYYSDYFTVIGTAQKEFIKTKTRSSPIHILAVESIYRSEKCDAVIINHSAIKYPLNSGEIKKGEIFTISPFNDSIVKLKIKGAELLELAKNQNSVIFGFTPVIKTSTGILTNLIDAEDKSIDMNRFYTICVNDFIFTGGNGYEFPRYLQSGKIVDVVNTKKTIYDFMCSFIEKNKKITPNAIKIIYE